MKRKLAIWLKWEHWSEYHCRQLAEAISEYYDTTITYHPLDWDEFDVVFCFFAGPDRYPECEREKIVKCLFEPHEYGMAHDAGVVVACSKIIHRRIVQRYKEAFYAPFGVNPAHFFPESFSQGALRVGWAGSCRNPRKRFEELYWAVLNSGAIFEPSLIYLVNGKMVARLPSEEMHKYYAGIHIYACASHSEGFHFPFLEASACGRPIVTLDVGIARDLKDSGAGVTIVGSLPELSEAIKCTWSDRSFMRELGQRSLAAVEDQWVWDKARDRWLEVFDAAG